MLRQKNKKARLVAMNGVTIKVGSLQHPLPPDHLRPFCSPSPFKQGLQCRRLSPAQLRPSHITLRHLGRWNPMPIPANASARSTRSG